MQYPIVETETETESEIVPEKMINDQENPNAGKRYSPTVHCLWK